MNIVALIVIILIGLVTDWENAAWLFGGYCLAFIVVGLTHGRVLER